MSNLSALIVINNEEKQIEECLKTLSFVDEIIVVLDKCTDNSESIVKRYTKKFYSGNWNLEGERRNFGISKCSKEWILEIDADERITKKLQKELINKIKKSKFDWHKIPVKNFIGKTPVENGWGAYIGKSAYIGLFRKGMKVWGRQRVHPEIKLRGLEGETLKYKLDHYYCKNISDLFLKLDSYSTARAKDLENFEHKENLIKNVRRIFSRFWKCFYLRGGYKEKDIGVIIAIIAALYPLLSYLKYREAKK